MATTSSTRPPKLNRKVAVMGYPYVGKSAIVLRFIQGYFPDKYESTIEDQHSKSFSHLSRDFQLKVTDTAGQQEYTVFPRSCSLDVHGFILVYAIDDKKSFEMVTHIHNKIMETYGDCNLPILIIGNKIDVGNDRVVPRAEGEELARKLGAQFMEFSAKESPKVSEVFEVMIREIEISRGNLSRPIEKEIPKNSCTIA